MSQYYSQGPKSVPEGLTNPTPSFKKHVIIATISLFLFVAIYTILMCWFALLSYNLFMALALGTEDNTFFNIVAGICLAFLSFFMLKSLFIFQKNDGSLGKEVTEESEPELVRYLHQLADEAGAPRPHKIFLSSRVNASVFYDLNIFNLIYPTKKNLEIGLGLINILSLGELKAVLAHEFGHFAQRSMLLGRYVYTAQQIAVRVINKRDALDNILAGLSSIDIRIAWIGWILSILVWAIRSLIQTLFSIVSIAERALSREMEFQADLVAVSLTGSDALINALYKLKVADEAYHIALGVVEEQLGDKKAVEDMFAIQSNYIEKMRWILNDQSYGKSPEIINKDGSDRVFTKGVVNPPEMWSTHPADNDREANAKNTYIYADIDDRSSWLLFSNPEALRMEVTKELIETAKIETTLLSTKESVDQMNKNDYGWSFLNPKFKGAYLSRFSMLNFKDIEDIYEVEVDLNLKNTFNAIYTDELSDVIDHHKEVKEEMAALEAVQYEVLTAEKRKIMHRGNQIKRKDIPEIIDQLNKEEEILRSQLIFHDRQARKVHYEAAVKLDAKLAAYLKQLTALVHYAEHSVMNLDDMNGKFGNTLNVIMADGKVTSSEMNRLVGDCNELHRLLKGIYSHRATLKFDKYIEEKLGKPYLELLEEFKLGLANPDADSMNRWMEAAGTWVNAARFALMSLRNASLERLLNIEDQVKEAYLASGKLAIEAEEIKVPSEYPTLLPGSERELQYELSMWDRFVIGDGIIPSMAKFSVSASLIIAALYIGNVNSVREAHIYNGLDTSVKVDVNGKEVYIQPFQKESIDIIYGLSNTILTTTLEGDTIDYFEPNASSGYTYVYNIASAGMAYEYTVSYGYDNTIPPTYYGAERWCKVTSDYILEEAPSSISSYASTSRKVFEVDSKINPYTIIELVTDEKEQRRMIESHVLFDDSGSDGLIPWLSIAGKMDGGLEIIAKRIEKNPFEIVAWRAVQNNLEGAQKDSVCAIMEANLVEDPENSNAYYLKVRCMEDSQEQDQLFIKGNKKWPSNSWLSYASAFVYAANEEWEAAYNNYGMALEYEPQLSSWVSTDFERIHRLMKAQGKDRKAFDNLLTHSEDVNYTRRLETGLVEQNAGDSYYTCYLVAQNQLMDAYDYAKTYPEDEAVMTWYIAASMGAPRDIITKALVYTTEEGINNNTIWLALALRAKEGRLIDDFLNKLEDIGFAKKDVEVSRKFIQQVLQNNISEAREILKDNSTYQFSILNQLMGVIILEDRAPEDWKRHVKHMLFVYEKPYLGNLDEV